MFEARVGGQVQCAGSVSACAGELSYHRQRCAGEGAPPGREQPAGGGRPAANGEQQLVIRAVGPAGTQVPMQVVHNNERLAGLTWPLAERRVTVIELTE
jgi:hypothetical protein